LWQICGKKKKLVVTLCYKGKICGKLVAKRDRLRSRMRHILDGFTVERKETRGKNGAKKGKLCGRKSIFAVNLR